MSTESKTPESDKVVFETDTGHEVVPVAFARTLETQRDEARAELLAERKRVGDAATLNMRLAHEKQGAEVALMEARAEVERLRKQVAHLEDEIQGLKHLWVPSPPQPVPSSTTPEIFEAHGNK